MSLQEKQLAQARENSTTAVSVYSPGTDITAIIRGIFICNVTNDAINIDLYCDDDGTTYDQSTAIVYNLEIPKNTTVEILEDSFFAMDNTSGNLAYKTYTANAATITVFGAEVTP